jgi:hypothetical protein
MSEHEPPRNGALAREQVDASPSRRSEDVSRASWAAQGIPAGVPWAAAPQSDRGHTEKDRAEDAFKTKLGTLERPPQTENQEWARATLLALLGSTESSLSSLDTRASAVPVVITGLAAIGFRSFALRPEVADAMKAAAVVAAVAAFFSVACAFLVVFPRRRTAGPSPERLVGETPIDPLSYRHRSLMSLAWATSDAIRVNRAKGKWFGLELAAAGIALAATFLFVFLASPLV